MQQFFKHTWPFMLAACFLLFIACAELPVSEPRTTSSTAGQNSPPPDRAPEVSTIAQPEQNTVNPSLASDSALRNVGENAGQTNVPPANTTISARNTIDESDAGSNRQPMPGPVSEQTLYQPEAIMNLCSQIGSKLGSVSIPDCQKHGFTNGGGHSVNGRPLVIKEILPSMPQTEDFRVLIMGGIHGDEYASISILFKWLDLFSAQGMEGEFNWRFAPLVNPDGLLDGQAKRQNANGVDLNRNFPSQDWTASAVEYWQESTGSNPRRFPGANAASEPEVQWLVSQIEEYQPNVIVSLHAPYHLLDFDGPADAPDKIGELYLHQLGVYPGSLGNYAGLNKRIPVVTLELPSAGIMPPPEQINLMWHDLVAWLDREGRKGLIN